MSTSQHSPIWGFLKPKTGTINRQVRSFYKPEFEGRKSGKKYIGALI